MSRVCSRTLNLGLLLLATVLASNLAAQQPPQPSGEAKPATPSSAGISPVKAFEQHAAYWSSEPGWDTELQLKNNLAAASLTVTPVLRLVSGQEIPLDPLTIPPNASVSRSVNEGLLTHAPNLLNQPGSYGSVVFRFASHDAMNLHAAAVVTISGQPIAFLSSAHPAGPAAAPLRGNGPGSLEGIWWQPRSGLQDILAISNSSEKTVNGNLSLFDASGKQWSEALSLGPHQTRRMATSDLLQEGGLSGSYGGISFAVTASADAVDAVHFMFDEATKFSLSLDLSSRDPNATVRDRTGSLGTLWTMRAPMLALSTPDPALGLPSGTVLQPAILVRNTTSKKISASLTLSWRGDSGKGQTNLPELELAPFATQQLQIGAIQKQLGIPNDAHWALVTLSANALPDDLIALASSRDSSGRYHLETKFSGDRGGSFAGGEWRADATHNEIVAITNVGAKATNALLTLHYDNGGKKYELQQIIQPSDQMWVNLTELIHNQVPDRNGDALPADVSSVTYDLQDLTPAGNSLTASTLAVNNTLGNQVIPDCPSCCGDSSVFFTPATVDCLVDGTCPLTVYGVNSCSGTDVNLDGDFPTWGSDNSSIATVTRGMVRGVAAGTTTAYAIGDVPDPGVQACGCPLYHEVQLNAPVTVLGILSISPATGVIGSTVPVTISGYGFGTAPTVTATGQISVANVQVNPSGTVITANLKISSLASAGHFTVVVTNTAGQANTPFYITKSCNPTVFAPSPPPIACDGKTVYQAQLAVSGSDEVNVTDTIATATSNNDLTVMTEGSPYTYSAPACPPGEICYDENYIGYTNNQSKSANINWSVQIFCSNSPYPSETVNPSATVTCQ